METMRFGMNNAVVGPHPLDNFMKNLSKKLGLFIAYTNHCIRSTVIGKLDDAGYEARHNRTVSGHKSDKTIKCYARQVSDTKKRQMSLYERLVGKNQKP